MNVLKLIQVIFLQNKNTQYEFREICPLID